MTLSWLYHGWVMDGSWMCHGWVMDVSWMCHGWVMDGSWMCHGCVMNVSWMGHAWVMDASWMCHDRVRTVWLCHGCVMTSYQASLHLTIIHLVGAMMSILGRPEAALPSSLDRWFRWTRAGIVKARVFPEPGSKCSVSSFAIH